MNNLTKAIKTICKRNNVSLKAWIEIKAELNGIEKKDSLCSICGHQEISDKKFKEAIEDFETKQKGFNQSLEDLKKSNEPNYWD